MARSDNSVVNTSPELAAVLSVSPDFYARPENVEEREEEMARRIVMRLSHGNVRLQAGKYSTKSQIDAEYAAIADIDFSS